MGAGNYTVSRYAAQAGLGLFYVDDPDLDDDADFEFECWHQDLEEDILDLLPPSFHKEKNKYREDGRVIASNQLIDVIMADNQCNRAVAIIAKEQDGWDDYSALAGRHIDNLEKRLINGLLELPYELYARCGPWTSAKIGD